MDQGDKRVALDVWEPQPRILNPLAEWSWADVTAFVDAEGVPVNPAHSYAFRSDSWIDPTERHKEGLPWKKVRRRQRRRRVGRGAFRLRSLQRRARDLVCGAIVCAKTRVAAVVCSVLLTRARPPYALRRGRVY